MGHIDNLQMREDAGRTQWNRVGFVYTRVSHALESAKNALLFDLRFLNSANGSQKKRSMFQRIELMKRFRAVRCKS